MDDLFLVLPRVTGLRGRRHFYLTTFDHHIQVTEDCLRNVYMLSSAVGVIKNWSLCISRVRCLCLLNTERGSHLFMM